MADTEARKLPEDTSFDEERRLAHRARAGAPIARRELGPVDPAALERADKIQITGLQVFANHGVYPEERELGQKFTISVTLYANLALAGGSDDLSASVDYGEACHLIDSYVRGHTFKLIEALAEGVARELLGAYPIVAAARVKVSKPWAPIGLPLEDVSVEVVRGR